MSRHAIRCFCGRYCKEDGSHAVPRGYTFHTERILPRAEALPYVERLVRRYGSNKRAGIAYAERHGLSTRSGERLILRMLYGPQAFVTDITLDRLSVMD